MTLASPTWQLFQQQETKKKDDNFAILQPMTQTEPVVTIKISDVYNLVLATSNDVKAIKQAMDLGNFEARIKTLEEAKWKLSGMAGILGGIGSFILTKIHLH